MTRVDVDRRTRCEHDSIRTRLRHLEVLVARLEAGGPSRLQHEIGDDLESLLKALRDHLDWEDGNAPGVIEVKSRGLEVVTWLRESHDELRAVLDFCRCSCDHQGHPVILAERIHDLADLLRTTLEDEESLAIAPSALCDDTESEAHHGRR